MAADLGITRIFTSGKTFGISINITKKVFNLIMESMTSNVHCNYLILEVSHIKKLEEPTRVNDEYLNNILLKINGNLGGLNLMQTTEHGLNILMISKISSHDVEDGRVTWLSCKDNVASISKWIYIFGRIRWSARGGRMDTRYDGHTFVSVRGAGHEVPLHRPQLDLLLVKASLSRTAMPTPPQKEAKLARELGKIDELAEVIRKKNVKIVGTSGQTNQQDALLTAARTRITELLAMLEEEGSNVKDLQFKINMLEVEVAD
ncbi:hypothetical protein GIB67_013773, partial [Kingdonia uniflora]